MLEVDCHVQEAGRTVLVAAVVESRAPTPRRLRLDSRLEGPVRPPRRRGLPEPGWNESGFEGVVPAGGRLALGFAASGPPADPPVEVTDLGRADDPGRIEDLGPAGDVDGTDGAAPTPTDVLRDMGSPAPPRDAVPRTDVGGSGGTAGGGGPDREQGPGEAERDEPPVPAAVSGWLDAVEARVERAEGLARASDVDAAAGAIEHLGGLAAVEALLADLADDEAALRAVAGRASTLADACTGREAVPVDSYRRLA